MNINIIDCIEDILGTTTLLVSVSKFGNGDRNLYARELNFGGGNLGSKLRMRKDVVV